MTSPTPLPCGNEDLLEAACEVLDRMYFASLAPAEEATEKEAQDVICVQVGFRGSRAGALQLRIAQATAAQLHDDFTAGDGTASAHEAVLDGVGELANMICGSFLSNTDPGGEYRIARPLPARPDAFQGTDPCLRSSLSVNGSVVEVLLRWRSRETEGSPAHDHQPGEHG